MATGKVTEAIVEEVADNLEEAAAATRQINPKSVGFFFGGVCVGAAVGFYFGYRFNKEKIRAEVFAKSEEEVEKIRELYRERPSLATEPKPTPEQIVQEQGYDTPEVVERDEPPASVEDIASRPLPAPVPIDPTKRVVRTEEAEKDKNTNWNYADEMAQRTAVKPYIIHQDEFTINETDFPQATLTYYTDDVLTEEDDTVIDNVEQTVGLNNLKRFGHGTDDMNVLYVRNPKTEVEYEICRSPGSYEQEVMGLEHSGGLERMRRRRPDPDGDETS
jgi:hypothetical protein